MWALTSHYTPIAVSSDIWYINSSDQCNFTYLRCYTTYTGDIQTTHYSYSRLQPHITIHPNLEIRIQVSPIPGHYSPVVIHTWTLQSIPHSYLDITVNTSSIPGHYSPVIIIHTWTLQSSHHPYKDITVQTSSVSGHYSPDFIHTMTSHSSHHPYLDITLLTSSIPGHHSPDLIHTWTSMSSPHLQSDMLLNRPSNENYVYKNTIIS